MKKNYDPTYLAAQIYFAILFNDNTLINKAKLFVKLSYRGKKYKYLKYKSKYL